MSSTAPLYRLLYAIHRDYEQEELAKPRAQGPTARERGILPARRVKKRLESLLGGRTTQQKIVAGDFPPLQGGTLSALALLGSQPSVYAQFLLGRQVYNVTSGDLLTTHRLKDVKVGDVIRFNRIVEVGSRDYTLRIHAPRRGEDYDYAHYLMPAAVSVCGVVVEHTRSNVHFTLRRGLRRKRLRGHVNGYTRIRVGRVKLGSSAGQTGQWSESRAALPLSQVIHDGDTSSLSTARQ